MSCEKQIIGQGLSDGSFMLFKAPNVLHMKYEVVMEP